MNFDELLGQVEEEKKRITTEKGNQKRLSSSDLYHHILPIQKKLEYDGYNLLFEVEHAKKHVQDMAEAVFPLSKKRESILEPELDAELSKKILCESFGDDDQLIARFTNHDNDVALKKSNEASFEKSESEKSIQVIRAKCANEMVQALLLQYFDCFINYLKRHFVSSEKAIEGIRVVDHSWDDLEYHQVVQEAQEIQLKAKTIKSLYKKSLYPPILASIETNLVQLHESLASIDINTELAASNKNVSAKHSEYTKKATFLLSEQNETSQKQIEEAEKSTRQARKMIGLAIATLIVSLLALLVSLVSVAIPFISNSV